MANLSGSGPEPGGPPLRSASGTTGFQQRWRRGGRRRSKLSPVVLIVDDEPAVLQVTAAMLEDLGCDVLTAGSGGEALTARSGNQPIEVLTSTCRIWTITADKTARLRPDLRVLLRSGREGDGYGLPLLREPFVEADVARTMSQTTGLC
jgi:two-component system, cell cycle response regulator CpdR